MKAGIYVFLIVVIFLAGILAHAVECPSEKEFRMVLLKAAIDYKDNPGNSTLTKDELRSLMFFYLKNNETLGLDCSPGGVDNLLGVADYGIPDQILVKRSETANLPLKCSTCSDGTKCSDWNSKGQKCTCLDTDKDSRNEFCSLKPAIPKINPLACSKCPDGTYCGQKNRLNSSCDCKDSDKDGRFDICYILHSCDSCSDGTGCGLLNSKGEICKCSESSCYLRSSCNTCPDGTLCGLVGASGQRCICKDYDLDGSNDRCYSRSSCDGCADGTSCGRSNSQGVACKCLDYDGDGVYDSCSFSSAQNMSYPYYCNSCKDGTACGKADSQNRTCKCSEQVSGGVYKYCYPAAIVSQMPLCNSCIDSTPCGKDNRDAQLCECTSPGREVIMFAALKAKILPGRLQLPVQSPHQPLRSRQRRIIL